MYQVVADICETSQAAKLTLRELDESLTGLQELQHVSCESSLQNQAFEKQALQPVQVQLQVMRESCECDFILVDSPQGNVFLNHLSFKGVSH